MSGPLSHIKVLDLSRVLAGPWVGQMLADFGAQVIKVERPGSGDDTRKWGPPYAKTADGETSKESAYFLSTNRAKHSVAIDMSHPDGQALIRDLAAECDILLENFKVGGLKKYGLDYDSLKAVNPALIYCSITGFGQTGPYAQRAGYDFMIQAMGGLMSVTGEPDAMPGGGPVKVGVALTDIMTGLYAGNAVMAALAHRTQTGKGQHIDLALLDVQVATLANQASNYLNSGVSPGRLGNAHPNIVPYQAFKTADGHIVLAVGNDGQFQRFCEVAGRAELAADERFASNGARVTHRETLVPQVAELMLQYGTAEWLKKLEAVGVPCGPINTIEQVFADPQVQAREMRRDLAHSSLGTVPQVANPIRFSESPIDYVQGPPVLGEHTTSTLKNVLGLSEDKIATLRDAGVVAQADI